MGMYVHIMTAKKDTEGCSDAAEIGAILGFTPADVAAVKAIKARYEPILRDQMRADWCEQYAAETSALGATPGMAVASSYLDGGFGKVRWHGADALTKNGSGECAGADAIAVLRAQCARFDPFGYPADRAMLDAIERAIDAVRDGRVIGVCWF